MSGHLVDLSAQLGHFVQLCCLAKTIPWPSSSSSTFLFILVISFPMIIVFISKPSIHSREIQSMQHYIIIYSIVMKATFRSQTQKKANRRKSFLIQLLCPEFVLFAVHCGEKCRNLLLIQNEISFIKLHHTIPEQISLL